MKRDNYDQLLSLVVKHQNLADERKQIEARRIELGEQLIEIKGQMKAIEDQVQTIASLGEMVINFDDRTLLIQFYEGSVSIRAIPKVLITE